MHASKGLEWPIVILAALPLSFDKGVSRRHAKLSIAPGGLLLEDLGSTNGTFVNGERIASQRLQDGDRVTVGRVSFTVHTRRR